MEYILSLRCGMVWKGGGVLCFFLVSSGFLTRSAEVLIVRNPAVENMDARFVVQRARRQNHALWGGLNPTGELLYLHSNASKH